MFGVPVHAPVKELEKRVGLNRADRLAEVVIIFFQSAMLRHAQRIDTPAGNEGRKGDDQGKDPISAQQGCHNDDDMEEQQNTRPPDSTFVLFRLIYV